MYTLDGKSVIPPYGRRNTNVSSIEFNSLVERVIALEEAAKKTKPVDEADQVTDTDIEALKAEAIELGIEVKGNWGEKRIRQAIADKRVIE